MAATDQLAAWRRGRTPERFGDDEQGDGHGRGLVCRLDGDSADASLPHAPRQPRARSDRAVFELKAGEKLTVAASGLVHFFLIDKDSAIAWREGRLEFADASLGDVIEAINRYTARPLVIADPSIAAQRFTGTVFLRSIDDWIASLPSVFQVSLDQSNPDITVLSRR